MAFNLDNFKNQPPIVVIKDEDINGLFFFKKRLEQLFFSDVVIRNSDIRGKTAKLIIEISCNFDLGQGMIHLNEGIWAQLRQISGKTHAESEFYKLVLQLEGKNDFPIEVEEFSLLFNDSAIIINELYKRSIPEQLDAILSQLSAHFANLSKSKRMVPYEIFIPVYEEDTSCPSDAKTLVSSVMTDEHNAADYFNFWGLYFDNCEDALIYDLKNSIVIKGNLNMLND